MTGMGTILKKLKTEREINSDFSQVLSERDVNPVTHPGVKQTSKHCFQISPLKNRPALSQYE